MESSFISPYRDDIVISWPELHRDTRVLCHALMEKGPFKGIIAIARGGLIPAALVARELEIRLLDTICASSYEEAAENGEGAQIMRSDVKVLKGVDHDGEGYLLIDDLVDTGNTARVIRKLLPKAYFATLVFWEVNTGNTSHVIFFFVFVLEILELPGAALLHYP